MTVTKFTKAMGTKRSLDDDDDNDIPVVVPDIASLFEPEIVQPEWLELPMELQQIDFQTEGFAAAAWDKYQPYSDTPPLLIPLDTPPTFFVDEPGHSQRALCFHLHAMDGRARAGTIHFNNSAPPVPTPRFMPVGTKGTVKSVLPQEIQGMNCPMILANTYHLALQPGTPLIDSIFGGLPNFMGGEQEEQEDNDPATTLPPQQQQQKEKNNKKKRRRLFNLLTDSGGFQMVSLAALSNVTEEGVVFESPYEKGKVTKLRPEDSIHCQNQIGADVIMQLDDVISSVQSDDQRFRLATLRTLRWYDRCVQAHSKPCSQNLYPILQGHLDISRGGLRELCLAGLKHRDILSETKRSIPGFAIGGLAGGEAKEEFWRVVDHACRHLPDNRPRYLMGVGYPLDLVVCTALGVDQYDCVCTYNYLLFLSCHSHPHSLWSISHTVSLLASRVVLVPTRTARFGVALVDKGGQLKLKQHEFAFQHDTILMEGCPCQACARGVSRARIHALLKSQNVLAVQLLTQHNLCYMMGLVTRMREAILQSKFQEFVNNFLKVHFDDADADAIITTTTAGSNDDDDNNNNNDEDKSNQKDVGVNIPQWVRDALQAAGVTLTV